MLSGRERLMERFFLIVLGIVALVAKSGCSHSHCAYSKRENWFGIVNGKTQYSSRDICMRRACDDGYFQSASAPYGAKNGEPTCVEVHEWALRGRPLLAKVSGQPNVKDELVICTEWEDHKHVAALVDTADGERRLTYAQIMENMAGRTHRYFVHVLDQGSRQTLEPVTYNSALPVPGGPIRYAGFPINTPRCD
jgi:hypothetical protein